ncbi:hypothetical protein TNCT_179741 [Trichonephila clavata]|uniref:Uncharacterized protein n=1 Tax=Trichonephila clavata TaxID=2740835 RepID=A0A8X6M4J9_TRICU|nr:hypothetical protein TNCT_179741 [Trichonephila clavata]
MHLMRYKAEKIPMLLEKRFDWILENDLMLLNDKSPTYLHSPGIFTSIDLSLSSINLNYELSWSTNTDNFRSNHLPTIIQDLHLGQQHADI